MTISDRIKAVQRKLNIDIDGDAGDQTWTAIYNALGCQDATPRLDEVPAPQDPRRLRIIEAAKAIVGRMEKTGHNDGAEIDEILAACGMSGQKQPYCGCTNRFVYDKAGLKDVGPWGGDAAWSPNWLKHPTWLQRGGDNKTPLPGDVFGIYSQSLGRIAHTGIIVEWGSDRVITIEGNTSAFEAFGTNADRNGDGVYMKRRRTSEFYAVRNWIG